MGSSPARVSLLRLPDPVVFLDFCSATPTLSKRFEDVDFRENVNLTHGIPDLQPWSPTILTELVAACPDIRRLTIEFKGESPDFWMSSPKVLMSGLRNSDSLYLSADDDTVRQPTFGCWLLSCCMTAALDFRRCMRPLHVSVDVEVHNSGNYLLGMGSYIVYPEEEVKKCRDALEDFWSSTREALAPFHPNSVDLRL
ncbi:hypothetical protein DUNSADRAFT_9157 [Dunaliella salina]|uniref:Uncharacterized protein n=1 Tax=Dunaliella salina TaxID=3046 RepID=A0ABQ7FTA1_DUNSA|nr:hypothetical protein DUNSADRAFT_9157 [Dunaliella salina]|eukprot:KAF5825505.1 hypothetical protein DUNSADRAFT_9157 [Dunaliella salina]